MRSKRPKLLVFDLDYTLWPFWVDSHVSPPFRKSSRNDIFDSYGTSVACYPEVPSVLKKLQEEGYVMAVASRTGEIQGARQLIDLFGWQKYFKCLQIFPGSKTTHLNNIKRESEIDFSEMIFFDDEKRNIRDVEEMGVFSVKVNNGITKKLVEEAINKFAGRANKIAIIVIMVVVSFIFVLTLVSTSFHV